MPESHRWVLDKLDRSMIKQDDPFVHNNSVWRLGLNYYRQREATLKITIGSCTNPLQDKKSKMYFQRGQFFLPTGPEKPQNMFQVPDNMRELSL